MNETATMEPTTPLPTTVESLTAAVKADPADRTAQLVLADAIMEADGATRGTATKRVRKIARDAEDKAMSPAAVARWLKGSNLPDEAALTDALNRAQRGMRVRTLTIADVLRCVREVFTSPFPHAWSAIGGDTVANSYKYTAYRTACVVAKRTNGTLRIAIGAISARHGSSLTNWATGLNINARAEQFTAWADGPPAAPTPPPPETTTTTANA